MIVVNYWKNSMLKIRTMTCLCFRRVPVVLAWICKLLILLSFSTPIGIRIRICKPRIELIVLDKRMKFVYYDLLHRIQLKKGKNSYIWRACLNVFQDFSGSEIQTQCRRESHSSREIRQQVNWNRTTTNADGHHCSGRHGRRRRWNTRRRNNQHGNLT